MTPGSDSPRERAASAARVLSSKLTIPPRVAVVLGSGLGRVLQSVEIDVQTSASELLGSPTASVAGHAGTVIAGRLGAVPIIAFLGRLHLYEGLSPDEQTLPVLLSSLLGADTLILTNASGGINPKMSPGDLMIISDQINLTASRFHVQAGRPNIGPTDIYDPLLTNLLEHSASEAGLVVHRGVYAGGLGPSYETAAEIRMLHRIGADAVGMSTVLEALAGKRLGMRVVGISVITNLATGISSSRLSHEEVTIYAAKAGRDISTLITGFLGALGSARQP